MTRINVGIHPRDLTDKHLIAEHREIKRIPNCISKGRCNMNNIPDTFRLGTGHVKFFYNKLLYLKLRYERLYNECKKRGFKVQNYIDSWNNIPDKLMGNYFPTSQDIEIIQNRINEKLNKDD